MADFDDILDDLANFDVDEIEAKPAVAPAPKPRAPPPVARLPPVAPLPAFGSSSNLDVQDLDLDLGVDDLVVDDLDMAGLDGDVDVLDLEEVDPLDDYGMGGPAAVPMPANFSGIESTPREGSLVPKRQAGGATRPKTKRVEDTNDEASDAFTFSATEMLQVDDTDWPDPERKDIIVRKPTPGKEKLILTVALADRTSKKLAVTDDFTCEDLLLMMCKKMDVWQTEFFRLCLQHDNQPEKWLDPRKTLAQERISANSPIVVKLQYIKWPKKLFDTRALYLYYVQLKEAIVSGVYPCPDKLAVRLAAHQMQITAGNFIPAQHRPGFLGDKAIVNYLPQDLLQDNPTWYLEARIFSLHRGLLGKSEKDAMEGYLKLAQQIQTYGANIYVVKDSSSGRTKSFGVAEDGILVSTDENVKRFNFYSFKFLAGWKATPTGFSVEVTQPQMVLEYEAGRPKVDAIIDLLCAYYVFLLGVDPTDLPLVQLPRKPQGLPDPRMFQKPDTALKRNLSDQTFSRLELMKQCYMKNLRKEKVSGNTTLLLQVDQALDMDFVLESLVINRKNMSGVDLLMVTDALTECFGYKPSEAEFFEENLSLATIDLSYNPLLRAPEDAPFLGKMLVVHEWHLKHLVLKGCNINLRMVQALSEFLADNKWLESIDLEDNDIRDKGVASVIKPLKGQEHCAAFNFNKNNLSGQVCFLLAQMLAKNPRVTDLRIGHNKVDDKGVGHFLEGLRRNNTLTALDISKSQFGSGAGRQLLKLLETNPVFKELHLDCNKLGTAWGISLGKLLKGQCPIVNLYIAQNAMGPKATRAIFEALKETRRLRELSLGYNDIDRKGGALLCECLSASYQLQILLLRKCGLSKGLLAQIGKSLTTNVNLKKLDLYGNDMRSPEVSSAWAHMLERNNALKELNLGGCGLTAEVFATLVAALGKNVGLSRLMLNDNKFGAAGYANMGKPISNNDHLEELSLVNTGAEPQCFTDFLQVVSSRNYNLKEVDVRDNRLLAQDDSWLPALKKIHFDVRHS